MRRAGAAIAAGLVVGLVGFGAATPAFSADPSPAITADPNHLTHLDQATPAPHNLGLVEATANALQSNPPLVQAPRAPLAVDPAQAQEVVAAINAAQTPIYMAVLAGSADGAGGTSREIHRAMGLPGTFLTIIGTVYDAYSTEFDAQPVLTRAYVEQHNAGTAAVLIRFAELSGETAHGTVDTPDLIAWRPTLIFIGLVLVLGFGYLFVRSRLEKEEQTDEPAPPPGAVDVPGGS